MNQNTGYKNWGYFLLIASLACILVATLSPWEFSGVANFSWGLILEKFNLSSDVKDYWQNILLFLPLGISISLIVTPRQQSWWLIGICFVVSAIVSISVEMTQLFLPTRISNLADILCNSLGGAVGGVLVYWRINIVRFLVGILTHNRALLSLKSVVMAIAIYSCSIVFAVFILSINVNLSNWHDDYYLAIGNEVSGDRPWQGYINSLYICDRALNQSEIERVFDSSETYFAKSANLVTALKFEDLQQSYQDRSHYLEDLRWHKNAMVSSTNWHTVSYVSSNFSAQDARIYQYAGILLEDRWLKTSAAAVHLNQRLKETGEFSIFLTVASESPEQNGPARIIALSDGIYAQNAIVAQSGKDLIFRLRTPVTGSNPNQPSFLIPNVFDSYGFQQILITFNHRQLDFYLNSNSLKYSFKFNIYSSFLNYLPWNLHNWTINLATFNISKYQILFYSIIVLPLIILLYYFIPTIFTTE